MSTGSLPFSGPHISMTPTSTHWNKAGSQKSKLAASKPEVLISRIADMRGTKLQRLARLSGVELFKEKRLIQTAKKGTGIGDSNPTQISLLPVGIFYCQHCYCWNAWPWKWWTGQWGFVSCISPTRDYVGTFGFGMCCLRFLAAVTLSSVSVSLKHLTPKMISRLLKVCFLRACKLIYWHFLFAGRHLGMPTSGVILLCRWPKMIVWPLQFSFCHAWKPRYTWSL